MNYFIRGFYLLSSILFWFSSLSLFVVQAQTINPEYISISDGLSSARVNGVLQDRYGLLWIATHNGLQMYDGNTFKTYKNATGQPNSLIDNEVWGIEEDKSGNLWIGTVNGISKFDRDSDSFTNYDFNEQFELTQFDGGWVINLLSDSQNRLWATTTFAGIILYNPELDEWGVPDYQFENSDEENTTDFSIAMAEASNGTIWVGSTQRGLYSLATDDSLFKKAPIEASTSIDFTDNTNHITALYSDRDNILWITTRTGVYKYNPQSGSIKTIQTYSNAIDIDLNYMNGIRTDDDGNVWISNNFRGILKFDGISDQYQEIPVAGTNRFGDGMLNRIPTDFYIDNSGIFWFGTVNTGLMKYDPFSNPFKHYSHQDNIESGLSGNAVYGLLESDVRPNTLFIGTRGGWLNILNRETATLEQVTFSAVEDMFGGTIRSISENEDGSLWLGTWGDGLIQTDSEFREMFRYTHNPDSLSGLSNNSVRVLKKSPAGDLWIGTNQGLNVLRAGDTSIQFVPNRFTKGYPKPLYELANSLLESDFKVAEISQVSNNQELSEPAIIDSPGDYLVISVGQVSDAESMADYGWIENNEGDTLWLGETLDKSYRAGGALGNRMFIEKISLEPGTINLRYISDSGHNYDSWVNPAPTFTDLWGITLLKVDDDELSNQIDQYLLQSSTELTINANSIQDIEFDGDIIWVASLDSGLDKLDTRTNTVTNYVNDPDDPNSLSGNSAYDIYQQPDGILWITTYDGLNRFDPETETFSHFTEEDGLPTNFTESILPGDNGGLWISTQSGLSQMITSESLGRFTFINYDASDGLGGDSFINQVAAKTDDGTYYFGGEHGMNEFTNIEANLTPPSMFISDLKISNRSVLDMGEDSPLDGSFYNMERIELSHTQNDLSFDFAALHYANPGKNQYAHILEGFDDDWVYDNRNFATYTNLEPGNYTFRIRGSNSDGIWNEEGKSLTISIAPPWWRTIWAYGFYFAILAGGFVTVDRVQRKRLMRKQLERAREKELKHAKEIEKAYQHLKAAQDQLVQQEKLASLGQLTAGIAHEIKNPLNFVNNFSDLSVELIEEAMDELKNNSGDPTETLEILEDIKLNLKKIHEHGSRADNIVKSMLLHSRGGDGELEPADLNELIKEYVNLSFHGMRAGNDPINVDIDLQLDEKVGEVLLISEDFSRVILNLTNNAFDAMREKLRADRPQHLSENSDKSYEPRLTVKTYKKDSNITIEIEDNGPGIPEEIKDKIMQPFFTTKKGTAGTGLGLSITNDIIKAHGGSLEVYSNKNTGTVFSIDLPQTK